MKRILIQTQLSNYDTNGKFILEADSGHQMMMGRIRQMLKLVPDLHIDIMGPKRDEDDMGGTGQLITHPRDINPDLWNKYGVAGEKRLRYIPHWIIANALATRYDFDFETLSWRLELDKHRTDISSRYDIVFINDPMHLRNFKALFYIKAGYQPKFICHSHFIDSPDAPKFPTEASLWLGQIEAAIKADYNFWQCESAMGVFFQEMAKIYQPHVVETVKAKSAPWDDGYSSEEINTVINPSNLRFDPMEFIRKVGSRPVIFVPNRIGGIFPGETKPRSSDYTRCGKFMFEVLPKLRQFRQDFVVVAGNPSQKIFNHELEKACGPNGYISLVPDALNRDEFKFVARNSAIAVGLYQDDAYGGTVARECIELGALPFWCDCNEYASIAREANYPFLCKADLSDAVPVLSELLENCRNDYSPWLMVKALQKVVRQRCSYEETTLPALKLMGLL